MPSPRPTRSDYVSWETATTRWADIDVYGHMNNARYFELIDTVVNNHLVDATGVDIRELPAIGVVAEVGCRYFAEVGYPEPVDLGIVVDRVGRSSVTYRVGLFQGSDEAAAEGQVRPRLRRQHRSRPAGRADPDADPRRRHPAAEVRSRHPVRVATCGADAGCATVGMSSLPRGRNPSCALHRDLDGRHRRPRRSWS